MYLKWNIEERSASATGTRYTYRLRMTRLGFWEVTEYDEVHDAPIGTIMAKDLDEAKALAQSWEDLEFRNFKG